MSNEIKVLLKLHLILLAHFICEIIIYTVLYQFYRNKQTMAYVYVPNVFFPCDAVHSLLAPGAVLKNEKTKQD